MTIAIAITMGQGGAAEVAQVVTVILVYFHIQAEVTGLMPHVIFIHALRFLVIF